MNLKNFTLESFSFDNKKHLNLLNDMIVSKDSNLISKDIKKIIFI